MARDTDRAVIRALRLPAIVLLTALAAGGHAQQEGDVPYVGTPPQVMQAMLEMANVGPSDFVVDLGCGDGRLVIAAAKTRGARGYGVDLDANLVNEARRAAEAAGVQDRVRFEVRNLYVTDFSRASVLTLYLFPRVNLELRPRFFRELRPGTRIVSHEFDFGHWRPDAERTVDVPDKPYGAPRSAVYLWIVPANAAGRWSWQAGGATYDVRLDQKFQALTPAVDRDAPYRVERAALTGDELALVVAAGGLQQHYRGRISGDTISGTVTAGSTSAPWSARRVAPGIMDIEAEPASARTNAKENR